MIDASPSQATLAASLSDLLVNHQHASAIRLPRHFIPSFFSTSAMSFCFFAHQRCISIIKGEKCCTPFTFLNRYGHTLHCIAHKSVQLRSIVYHLAMLNPFHFASLNLLFFSRKAVALHSRSRPLCATSFRPLLRKDIALHSITLSFRSFSMTLRAMEKSYITTSFHSTSYPFASGKAVPSVSYKAMPSWFGKAALSIIYQCEKAV